MDLEVGYGNEKVHVNFGWKPLLKWLFSKSEAVTWTTVVMYG